MPSVNLQQQAVASSGLEPQRVGSSNGQHQHAPSLGPQSLASSHFLPVQGQLFNSQPTMMQMPAPQLQPQTSQQPVFTKPHQLAQSEASTSTDGMAEVSSVSSTAVSQVPSIKEEKNSLVTLPFCRSESPFPLVTCFDIILLYCCLGVFFITILHQRSKTAHLRKIKNFCLPSDIYDKFEN